jgi:integrase
MKNGIGKLTALFVERCKTPGLYNDGGGLYLQVTSPTAKSWVYRYQGRYKGLGSVLAVSLAQARAAAHECRQQRQQGVDPIDATRALRAQRRLEAHKAITFKECAAAYINAHGAEWKNSVHREQWISTLAQVERSLGILPVQMIDTPAVHKALKPIWQATPTTASRLRGRIESVLDYARVSGYRDGENPARWRGHLDKLFAKVSNKAHHAAMPYADIPAFLAKLRERDGITARALELCILTALRTGEVTDAKWCEIDLANATWTIPAERMKAGAEHRVPLSRAALELLNGVARKGEYVFPGVVGKPIRRNALAKLSIMAATGVTIHGFRSAFRDWAADCTSAPNEVCEAALAHTIKNKAEAAYRRSDLFEKRRELMNAWARFCADAGDADVVPLRAMG